MRAILAVALGLLIQGCATPPSLTEDGRRVRIVKNTPHKCQYKGQASSYASTSTYWEDYETELAAHNMLKNRAAEMGANTIEIFRDGISTKEGEAYWCDYSSEKQPASQAP